VAVEGEGGEDGFFPPLDFVSDLGPGAYQGYVFDEFGGDGGDGAFLVAGQVVVLDLLGLGLVAHAGEYLVVEVDAASAHSADVESKGRTDEIGRPFGIVVDDDRQRAAYDVERVAGVAGAGAGEALVQGLGVEVVHGGREEDDVPAVGDLGGQGHVLRALGAEVDGDLGAVGMQDRAQRLAQAGGPLLGGQRKLVVLAVVADRLAAGDDLPEDLDVLPGALERPGVRLAVPALHHLGIAGADAEQDPALGQVVHGHRGHGQGDRRPGGQLGDGRAELDPRGARTPPGQRGPGVAAVGFRGPDLVDADPFGGLEQVGRSWGWSC